MTRPESPEPLPAPVVDNHAHLDHTRGGDEPFGDRECDVVRAGGGLSVLPDFLVADELTSGRLIHVLPEWSLPSGGIFTVYPAARFRPRKVTAFVEMLIAAMQHKGSIALA